MCPNYNWRYMLEQVICQSKEEVGAFLAGEARPQVASHPVLPVPPAPEDPLAHAEETVPRLPFCEAIVAFLADIARWQRERRSERTRAGLRRAVAQGKHLGRPKGSRDSRKRVVRRHSRPQLSGRLS